LYGIINNSESERINLETEKNNLIIKTDNYEAKIQGVAAEEYPIIPKVESHDYYFEIEAGLLKKVLAKVVYCAHLSEIRPEISGILFDFQLTIAKFAATDSFRLAEHTLTNQQYKSNFNRGFKVIVPIKAFNEFSRIFPDGQIVSIAIDANQILFKNEETEIISRLIDGDYPDYTQIIPKEIQSELQMSKEHFVNALKLVSNLSGKINDVKLRLKDKKVLEVYSANQYLGENNYLIPVKLKGDGFKDVNFNWRFLLDGLKSLGSEQIIFGVNGDVKPAVLRSPEDNSYLYIAMPIKNS